MTRGSLTVIRQLFLLIQFTCVSRITFCDVCDWYLLVTHWIVLLAQMKWFLILQMLVILHLGIRIKRSIIWKSLILAKSCVALFWLLLKEINFGQLCRACLEIRFTLCRAYCPCLIINENTSTGCRLLKLIYPWLKACTTILSNFRQFRLWIRIFTHTISSSLAINIHIRHAISQVNIIIQCNHLLKLPVTDKRHKCLNPLLIFLMHFEIFG